MKIYLMLLSLVFPIFLAQAFKLIIPALEKNQLIPTQFTCDGQDISPKISWNPVAGAKSYVLIMHDPDAPMAGGFTHWVVKNIPADAVGPNGLLEIPEGISPDAKIGTTGVQLLNSAGKPGYMGPCPPSGEHRYEFKLYSLDIAQIAGENKTDIEKNMQGHIIGEPAVFMRKYRRASK